MGQVYLAEGRIIVGDDFVAALKLGFEATELDLRNSGLKLLTQISGHQAIYTDLCAEFADYCISGSDWFSIKVKDKLLKALEIRQDTTAGFTVEGYSWELGDELHQYSVKKVNGESVEEWVPVLPFNIVPMRALREDADVGAIEAKIVYKTGRVKHVTIPAAVTSASRPAQLLAEECGVEVLPKQGNVVADFTSMIVNERSTVASKDVLVRAEWDDETLRVPGLYEVSPRKPFIELAKYGGTRGDEAAAKKAWAGVLQMARYHPKMLLALGMPLGSIYAARLRRPPYNMGTSTFALHLTGDSARGKTQLAVSAMMTLGDATEKSTRSNLYRTWDMSNQAPVALAHQLGVLPVFFDEAATSQKTPEEFTQQLFALAQGTERQRATVTGDLDEVDRWECCVLSTGEMRITAKSGLVGVRRRVQELYAPYSDSGTADMVYSAASQFYGWPLRWIAEDSEPDIAATLLADVKHEGWDEQITWLNAAALNLSICGLGALMLARKLNVEEVTVGLVRNAVRIVADKMARAAVEEGVDAGVKLLKAVWDAVAQRPNNFPEDGSPPMLTREREGVLFADGTVGVMTRSALFKIAREAGLPDPQAGVRLLAAQNLMVTEQSRDQIMKTINIGGGQRIRKRIYIFKPLEDRDA